MPRVKTDENGKPLSLTGKPVGRGNPPIPEKAEHAMRPEVLAEASDAMFGSLWRAEVGRRIGLERSMISRLAKGERTITQSVALDLHDLLINKFEVLALFMEEEDWPMRDDPATQAAVQKIKEAVQEMRDAVGEIDMTQVG